MPHSDLYLIGPATMKCALHLTDHALPRESFPSSMARLVSRGRHVVHRPCLGLRRRQCMAGTMSRVLFGRTGTAVERLQNLRLVVIGCVRM